MDLVSSLRAFVVSSYQGACPHGVFDAITLCAKTQRFEGEISPADMAVLNAAVEPGLGSSVVLATAYCKTVKHIVWDAGAHEHNRVTAGVYTVEQVLLAMTSHVCDADVQEEGAGALAALAIGNPVNIAGMLALGGIETLITSADTHIAARMVQNYVCDALYFIAKWSADGKTALLASRAAEVATQATATHSGMLYADYLLRKLSAE